MKLLKTLIFVLAALSMAWAKPPRPVIIDPTVFAFDSIPPVETDLTFFIDTVQDTSQQRNTTAIVGFHHIRSTSCGGDQKLTCRASRTSQTFSRKSGAGLLNNQYRNS